MRVAELSRRSGVPLPTIKYYLREGLLGRGEPTGPNQASYGEDHLHRLRLIRALIDVGGLSLAATRSVLRDVDEPGPGLDSRLGHVIGAINPASIELDAEDRRAARARMDALVEAQGWRHGHPDYPARRTLEEVLATLDRLGAHGLLDNLDRYADQATAIAAIDIDTLTDAGSTDTVLEQAVIGTVLGDALLASLRRVAQAAESGRRLSAAESGQRLSGAASGGRLSAAESGRRLPAAENPAVG